jgi:hypothetical protein
MNEQPLDEIKSEQEKPSELPTMSEEGIRGRGKRRSPRTPRDKNPRPGRRKGDRR